LYYLKGHQVKEHEKVGTLGNDEGDENFI